MANPPQPKPIKLFVALLSNDEKLFSPVDHDLATRFGPIDSASARLPWAVTGYYEKEMGPGLLRRFVSFALLISPEKLPEIKLQTQALEEKYQWVEGERRRRRVNLDPGYLDAGKVVLASTKYAAHRIYLRAGIYGEAALVFQNGSFQPFFYTYRDYLWPETLVFFAALRSLYLRQLRNQPPSYY